MLLYTLCCLPYRIDPIAAQILSPQLSPPHPPFPARRIAADADLHLADKLQLAVADAIKTSGKDRETRERHALAMARILQPDKLPKGGCTAPLALLLVLPGLYCPACTAAARDAACPDARAMAS